MQDEHNPISLIRKLLCQVKVTLLVLGRRPEASSHDRTDLSTGPRLTYQGRNQSGKVGWSEPQSSTADWGRRELKICPFGFKYLREVVKDPVRDCIPNP